LLFLICAVGCDSVYVADILNDCFCCDIANEIGENGVRDIAEALKVNTTLIYIDLQRESNISCVFFIHLSSIREQVL